MTSEGDPIEWQGEELAESQLLELGLLYLCLTGAPFR
jgi:hypothetical protein